MSVLESKSVTKWLSRLSESSRKSTMTILSNFMVWLNENGEEFSEYRPDQLVKFQAGAPNGDQYKILDLVQVWVSSLDLRYSSKQKYYTTLRSFFIHNRAELPKDPSFQLRTNKERVKGNLAPDEIKNIILASNESYAAAFLAMFQGGMGREEFLYWNTNGLEELLIQLENERVEVVKINLPGRKRSKFKRPYYTFIGPDAIEAIRVWLKIRPKGSDVIFTKKGGGPMSKFSLHRYWIKHTTKLGFVKRDENGGPQTRYGKNLHEMRDVWRSLWSKSSAEHRVAEFLMGHNVDPLGYDKSFDDENWTRKEYLKALPMLQILSSGKPFGQVEEEEVDRLNEKINLLETEVERYKTELSKTQNGLSQEIEDLKRMFYERLKPSNSTARS